MSLLIDVYEPAGPVILCPNHPNMLVDAILTLSEAARHGRNPYVWAKGSLFANPVAAFLLRKFGAVPVYRPRRAADSLADVDTTKTPEEIEAANRAMFEHTWRVLAQGNVMVLFPEGTSYTAPKMLALRSGVVRVAAGFVKQYDQPIPIVPVGLTYFNKDHFRRYGNVATVAIVDIANDALSLCAISQVTLEFGTPLVITPDEINAEPYQTDQFAQVKQWMNQLEDKMHSVTLNASDFDTIRVARGMRRLFLNTPGSIAANKEVRLTQFIVDMLEKHAEKPTIASVRSKVEAYMDELERLRMKDQEVGLPVDKKQSLLQLFVERVMYLLVLLPLATPGILLYLPYYFIGESVIVDTKNCAGGFY